MSCKSPVGSSEGEELIVCLTPHYIEGSRRVTWSLEKSPSGLVNTNFTYLYHWLFYAVFIVLSLFCFFLSFFGGFFVSSQ